MPPEANRVSRLESISFYLLAVAVVLAPLAFWPSRFFAIESVKTFVIGFLTTASAVLFIILSLKRREMKLPPKSMTMISLAMLVSVVASAFSSGNFIKSFFGQGFELGTGSFILTLVLAMFVAYAVTLHKKERVALIYTSMMGVYLLIFLVHVLRFAFGPNFLSLGVLNSVTSTLIGNWFSFGVYSAVIAIIAFFGITFLRLTSKMKIAYWVTLVASMLSMVVISNVKAWQVFALVMFGITVYLTSQKSRPEGGAVSAFVKRLAVFPLILTAVAVLFSYQFGTEPNKYTLAEPVVKGLNAAYSELILPWRLTIDIAAGELKTDPLLGSGPNRFSQAFLTYKPTAINTTDAWGVEFNSGFAFIPTALVTQGFLGGIVWTLFLVFFGILGVRSLRGLVKNGGSGDSIPESERAYARFAMLSSYSGSAMVMLMCLVYVPTHVVLFYGFVLAGIWLATSVTYGKLRSVDIVRSPESSAYSAAPIIQVIVLILVILWNVTYIKNTAALAYFGGGVKHLTVASDPVKADASFARALALNPLDIYWQARAESAISQTNKLLSSVTANSDASTTNAIVTESVAVANKALEYSNKAIAADPGNYNNFISQARVAELGTIMRMQNSYETAVNAYRNAILRNQGNPSLYLSLARLQASQNQLDLAVQTIGAALQVKQNYLDAVYLLSQIKAAQGNLNDAIVAAQFATELNPNNALLQFQLGLLQYNGGDYTRAASTLEKAASLQPNYANAQYFLGLSYARIGKNAEAIAQFEALAATNPESQEVAVILSTLKEGKSLFAPASPSADAARPEKKSTPPLKENN